MNSNSISSGTAQALSSVTPDRIVDSLGARAVREPVKRAKEPVAESVDRPQQVPSQVYNSHGRIVPSAGTSGTDFRA